MIVGHQLIGVLEQIASCLNLLMMDADGSKGYCQAGVIGNRLHGIFSRIDRLLSLSRLKLSLNQIGPDARIMRSHLARLNKARNCFPGLTGVEEGHAEGVSRGEVLRVQTDGLLELLNGGLGLAVFQVSEAQIVMNAGR